MNFDRSDVRSHERRISAFALESRRPLVVNGFCVDLLFVSRIPDLFIKYANIEQCENCEIKTDIEIEVVGLQDCCDLHDELEKSILLSYDNFEQLIVV